MDKAQELVRRVARAFYETEHIITVDALVNHVALTIDDMRVIFNNTGRVTRDFQKIFGRLKEGGLVTTHTRAELKPNAQKPTQVEYYYIDFRRAIDATKYRVHLLETTLNKSHKGAEKKKEWMCPRCKAEYTELEIVDSFDMETGAFKCKRCGFELEQQSQEEDAVNGGGGGTAGGTAGGGGSSVDSVIGMFNRQFAPIVKLLRQIDDLFIPHISPETAIAESRPVPRDREPQDLPALTSSHSRNVVVKPTAVKGMISGPEKVEVTITTEADNAAALAAAEAERRRKKELNALPEWYTHSTITNEATAAGVKAAAEKKERENELALAAAAASGGDNNENGKKAGISTPASNGADASLEAFYAALEEEKAREAASAAAAKAGSDDDEEEEDDEDEFEDVAVVGTPLSAAVNGNGNGALAAGDVTPLAKRLKVDLGGVGIIGGGGSETGSAVATPADGNATQDSDEEDFEDA